MDLFNTPLPLDSMQDRFANFDLPEESIDSNSDPSFLNSNGIPLKPSEQKSEHRDPDNHQNSSYGDVGNIYSRIHIQNLYLDIWF